MTPHKTPPPEELLRPCPFCGKTPEIIDESHMEVTKLFCFECSNPNYSFEKFEWQNAFCWKEIDSLKEQLRSEEKSADTLMDDIGRLQVTIERLEGENAKLKTELAVKYTMENIDKDVAALEGESLSLKKAFQRYGWHDMDCAIHPDSSKKAEICDCGYESALGKGADRT